MMKKLCKYEHREIYRLGSSEDWCHIKQEVGRRRRCSWRTSIFNYGNGCKRRKAEDDEEGNKTRLTMNKNV